MEKISSHKQILQKQNREERATKSYDGRKALEKIPSRKQIKGKIHTDYKFLKSKYLDKNNKEEEKWVEFGAELIGKN